MTTILKPGMKVRFHWVVRPAYWSLGESIDDDVLSLKIPENTSGVWRIMTRVDTYRLQVGVLVGWTFRQAGKVYDGPSYEDSGPGYLSVYKSYKVWVVAPISVNGRFRKLVDVLPEDLEEVTE